jgi:CRP-like cAMP-binding protein
MIQLAQNVACGRLHSVEQRLCRWLLGMSDRLRTGEIRITHEVIARALGVRREAVTIAAHHLLMERAIRNGRGHIVILDRARLEAGASSAISCCARC